MSTSSAVPCVFGPVPSRRFGRSLGVNDIAPKACSYSCVYCSLGRTTEARVEPRPFRPALEVAAQVRRRVEQLRARGQAPDVVTLSPDGEPTLDRGLGELLDALRPLGLPVAVITNGSLLGRDDVRAALAKADRVSLGVSTADERLWRELHRPHAALRFDEVLDGLRRFAREYRGELHTETMLVGGLNDGDVAVAATADLVERLRPRVAWLAIPTRPPAEAWVRPPTEAALRRAWQRFTARLRRVELLTDFEGTAFGATGDALEDLLGVAAVHPLREDAAQELVARDGADPLLLERLVAEGRLDATPWRGHLFYRTRWKDLARA